MKQYRHNPTVIVRGKSRFVQQIQEKIKNSSSSQGGWISKIRFSLTAAKILSLWHQPVIQHGFIVDGWTSFLYLHTFLLHQKNSMRLIHKDFENRAGQLLETVKLFQPMSFGLTTFPILVHNCRKISWKRIFWSLFFFNKVSEGVTTWPWNFTLEQVTVTSTLNRCSIDTDLWSCGLLMLKKQPDNIGEITSNIALGVLEFSALRF